jgi:ferredoxin hydrogenase
MRNHRIKGLYHKDEAMSLRLSHENPDIKMVYAEFYEKPLSEKAEKLLHTYYESKKSMLGN